MHETACPYPSICDNRSCNSKASGVCLAIGIAMLLTGCSGPWPIRYRGGMASTGSPVPAASARIETVPLQAPTAFASAGLRPHVQSEVPDPEPIQQVDHKDLSPTEVPPPVDPIPTEPEAIVPAEPEIPVAPVSGMTLEAFESLAIENNPAIFQASASAHKAIGFRQQVAKLPNPNLGYNATQLADAGTDQHTVFVEQDFIAAHKLARNAAVLDQEVQSQLWEVESQRYRVLTDVRYAFYTALAAQRKVELTMEFEEVAKTGSDVAMRRLEALEGSRPEVLQSDIQLQQVQVKRAQAAAEFRGAWRQLTAMVGIPDMAPVVLDGHLPNDPSEFDWDGIYVQLQAVSPELQAARARLCRAQANLDRQQVQAIPNLSFYLGAGTDNGTNSGMINAQVGMPLPVLNRNEGNIAAAQAEVCRAAQEIRRIEMSLKSRLGEASRDYDSAAAAVERYAREILPKAQENLTLAEAAYEGGQFDFLQVYVARRIFFEANLEYVDAQLQLAEARALVDGQLLSGGLDPTRDTEFDSALRDQALSGQ